MEVRQSHSIFFLQFYYVYVFSSVFIVSTGFCELTLLSRLIWNVYWSAGGSLCLCVYVNICLRYGAGAIWPLSTVIWNIERSWTSLSCSVPSTVVDVVGRLSSPPHTLPLPFRVIVFYSLWLLLLCARCTDVYICCLLLCRRALRRCPAGKLVIISYMNWHLLACGLWWGLIYATTFSLYLSFSFVVCERLSRAIQYYNALIRDVHDANHRNTEARTQTNAIWFINGRLLGKIAFQLH